MLPFRKQKADHSPSTPAHEADTVLAEFESVPPPSPPSKWKRFLKRFGILVFLFYLVKGLIWLVVFYFGGKVLIDKFF